MKHFTCRVAMVHPTINRIKTHILKSASLNDAVVRAEAANPDWTAYEVQMMNDKFVVIGNKVNGEWVTKAAERKVQ